MRRTPWEPRLTCCRISLEPLGPLGPNVDSRCHLPTQPGSAVPQLLSPVPVTCDSLYLSPPPCHSFTRHPSVAKGTPAEPSGLLAALRCGRGLRCGRTVHARPGPSHSEGALFGKCSFDTSLSVGKFISGFKQGWPSYGRQFNPIRF